LFVGVWLKIIRRPPYTCMKGEPSRGEMISQMMYAKFFWSLVFNTIQRNLALSESVVYRIVLESDTKNLGAASHRVKTT